MSGTDEGRVIDDNGRVGYLVGPADDAADHVAIQMEDGREISVPVSSLHPNDAGGWRVHGSAPPRTTADAAHADSADTTIPVISEELHVGTRKRVTGTVRIGKEVREHEEAVSMPLAREHAEIRRILVDRPVDSAPPIRRDGDTIILPIVEEVPVVRKQLVLKEEVHITRRRTTEQRNQTYTLREEQPVIERVAPDGSRTVIEKEPEPKRSETVHGLLGPRPKRVARKNKIIR
jgi:uncharacterized protein (TIGR02271 family)